MTQKQLSLTAIAHAIANLLERAGQLERTQHFYKRSVSTIRVAIRQLQIQLAPKNPWRHYDLAKAWLQQEQWQAAAQACQQAIKLAPQAQFYHALGDAWNGQGHWQAALQNYQQAIALDPNVAAYHYSLGKTLIEREEYVAAITACRQAVALEPAQFWLHHTLGEALLKAGQWEVAIAALRQTVTLQPAFPWSYYFLGDALLATEAVAEAIAAYQTAAQIRPSNPYINQSLEYALHLQSQWQKIADYCQRMQQVETASTAPFKILMVTPYTPYPPTTGSLVRMFHQLKCLGARHHLVVVSLMFSKADYAFEAELEEYCDLAVTVAIGDAPAPQPNQPKLVHRYSSQRLRKVLETLAPINFDIVSYNFVYMGQYAEIFPNAFNILDEHNIESELLKRSAEVQSDKYLSSQSTTQENAVEAVVESNDEAQLLADYENQIWQKFPLRTVVSDRDRQILDSRCSVGKTLVVKNGIDAASIQPLPQANSKTILFMGTLSYYPNIDGAYYLVEKIMPLIWQQDASISLLIAGSLPPQKIQDLAQDSRIQVIANPPDMSVVAENCVLSVVPLRVGSGTRIKILHSMAMGLPIVSTSLGCEGLEVADQVHLLVRDQPDEFAQAVLQLMMDNSLRQTLRQNGRTLVEQAFDWQMIYQQAEQEISANFTEWKAQQIVNSKG